MKTLIYSQEDLDLILSLKTEEKDKEIERLKNELAKIPKAKMEYDLEIEQLNNIINELEKCIKEKYNEAHNYQTKIRQSDLQQGDYPVSYYYAERDEKMSIYYLDKLKELKESSNNE